MLKEYLKEIHAVEQQDDAREESLYPLHPIGGYQVLDKWLDSRRERALSLEDIQHFCLTAKALHHSIALQGRIDALYPGVDARVLEKP